uniref:hypothetical protein n=1 Tax=Pseudomonas sp. EA_65y_Pfl1_P113 TaxID=3088692 RepID=UPI0030DD2162
GPIASAGTVIESYGSTSLVLAGSNFYFNPVSGGTGPQLKYGGAAFSAAALNGWAIIGAEQTGGGYEVALHSLSSDQYTVWNTDSSGNVIGNGTGGVVAGASSVLQALEPSFQQDLNGDGTIGTIATVGPTTGGGTVIESYGATSLVQLGSNFYFNPVAGGSGPQLK